MRKLVALLFLASPLWGGYTYKATVAFPGASGSTQANITLAFSFNDTRLATVANGGQIQNTVTRNGATVPADFVFTLDSTCATVTGSYTWGFDGDYQATTGTGHGWLMIPSYTTSGVTPTLCIGNVAVTTYQGGSTGAEFTSSLLGVWHLADGTTLSSVDYSASGCDGTPTNVTATSGQIGGGGSFTTSTSRDALGGSTCGSTGSGTPGTLDFFVFTYEVWIYTSTTGGDIFNGGANGMPQLRLLSGKLSLGIVGSSVVATSTGSVSTGAWHHVAVVFDGSSGGGNSGTYAFYLDGSLSGSGSVTIPSGWTVATARFVNHTWRMGQINTTPSMVIDEMRDYNTASLGADWFASEYANQSSPPAVSAFTALASVSNSQSVVF